MERIACHTCTAEIIDAIVDRLNATDPDAMKKLEAALRAPIPAEMLTGPETTTKELLHAELRRVIDKAKVSERAPNGAEVATYASRDKADQE